MTRATYGPVGHPASAPAPAHDTGCPEPTTATVGSARGGWLPAASLLRPVGEGSA